MMEVSKVKSVNIFLLGLCFCLVRSGLNTMLQTQALVYSSAKNLTAGNNETVFEVNGFVTNGIFYVVFSLSSWLAPLLVVRLGARSSMLLATLAYVFHISQYLYLNTVSVYIASVIIGIGAAILFSAQGPILADNSDDDTITRNSGIFWAMNMSSSLVANLVSFFMFQDQEIIMEESWVMLGAIITGVTASGLVPTLLMRPTPWVERKTDVPVLTTLKSSLRLFFSQGILLLSLTMFFTGINQSLAVGVYSGSIGFTKGFGPNRKALASLSGILVALGEVVGGLMFGSLAFLFSRRGRSPVIVAGCVLSLLCYGSMFLNFPMDANDHNETDAIGIIKPNKALALTTSFTLGFSDACYNTQVSSFLGGIYKKEAAAAFGIFKFVQSAGSALAFLYSPVLGFHFQLLLLAVVCVIATVTFVIVELKSRRPN